MFLNRHFLFFFYFLKNSQDSSDGFEHTIFFLQKYEKRGEKTTTTTKPHNVRMPRSVWVCLNVHSSVHPETLPDGGVVSTETTRGKAREALCVRTIPGCYGDLGTATVLWAGQTVLHRFGSVCLSCLLKNIFFFCLFFFLSLYRVAEQTRSQFKANTGFVF